MKKLIALGMCLLLTACATQPKITYVPTPVACHKPRLEAEPHYMPIMKGMAHNELVKALTVNYSLCRVDSVAIRRQCGG